ncbi:RNA polymerase III RPC4-domain-containing protein [Crassisporium funariophilum]|nr:RNA polymerase III RPC4-domain-containing protein [Crassisporium funariophilum]
MSDVPSGSNTTTPKAIGSLAKKQTDVTRQGTQKLKFVPTLPQRRKKEEVKSEPTPSASPLIPTSERGRGRGRGRGDARGRGRGLGAPPVVEMTASGPFAMGPTLAGVAARRSTPRSNFAPSVPVPGSSTTNSLSHSAPPSLKKDRLDKNGAGSGSAVKIEEAEYYSDPDEGVEIVDMDNVYQMDWMAPESLRKERQAVQKKIKKEEQMDDIAGIEANQSQALNLSESEEEEELEDIIEDFATQISMDVDDTMREERLYFFQFPAPFPTFFSKTTNSQTTEPVPEVAAKKVTFAPDSKQSPATATSSQTPPVVETESKKPEFIDGTIGQLEVYRSGAVKIRLANGILLDVNAATQPSFLQQAVYLNKTQKQLTVLGEVNRQFVASPNVEALLVAMEKEDNAPLVIEGGNDLIKMDRA